MSWEAVTNDSIQAPIANVVQSVDNPDVYNSFLYFQKPPIPKIGFFISRIKFKAQLTRQAPKTYLNPMKQSDYRRAVGMDNKLFNSTFFYKPINGFNNCSLMIYEVQGPSNYKIRQNLSIQVWASKNDYVHDVVVDLPFQPYSNNYQNKLEIIDPGVWQLNVAVKTNIITLY